jgi:hypothetical protein
MLIRGVDFCIFYLDFKFPTNEFGLATEFQDQSRKGVFLCFLAACRDASVIRGIFRVRNVIFRVLNVIFQVRDVFPSSYVTNSHAATISLDSSLKRAERN